MNIKKIQNSLYSNYEFVNADAGGALVLNIARSENNPTENAGTSQLQEESKAHARTLDFAQPQKKNREVSMDGWSPALIKFASRRREESQDEFDMFASDDMYDDFN